MPRSLGLPALLALCAKARYNFHKAFHAGAADGVRANLPPQHLLPCSTVGWERSLKKVKVLQPQRRHSSPSLAASPTTSPHSTFFFAAHHLFRKSVGFSNRECAFFLLSTNTTLIRSPTHRKPAIEKLLNFTFFTF